MSKVVHLSDEAHAEAKSFCKQRGLKMSDWVASLIRKAVAEAERVAQAEAAQAEAEVRVVESSTIPRKKVLRHLEEIVTEEVDTSIYNTPPFWSNEANHSVDSSESL